MSHREVVILEIEDLIRRNPGATNLRIEDVRRMDAMTRWILLEDMKECLGIDETKGGKE